MNRAVLLASTSLALAGVGCDDVLYFHSEPSSVPDAQSIGHAVDASDEDAPSDASNESTPPRDAACAPDDDPNNCGACGHSCLGGACTARTCQAVILASGQGNAFGAEVSGFDGGLPTGLDGPGRLATDGMYAYWLNLKGAVMRVAVGGGTPFRVATTAGSPVWIELDATYVYFMSAETGTIFRVVKTGGEPAELTPTPPAGGVGNEFLLYASALYWADTVADYMCPVAGCGGTPKNLWSAANNVLMETDGYSEFPYSMTVQSPANIFVSELASTGGVDIALPSAGMTCIDVPAGDRYVELHSDISRVYALSSQTVLAASATSCGPATFLASGMQGPPHALALDDGFVYWVNTGDGTVNEMAATPNTIQRCAKTGCANPETLATEPSTANGLAVDSTAVYWTTGDGKVKRLAKPASSAP